MGEITINIKLDSIDRIKEFSKIVNKYRENITLKDCNSSFEIDAKSIMGIFSLNLLQNVLVTFKPTKDIKQENIEIDTYNFIDDMCKFIYG